MSRHATSIDQSCRQRQLSFEHHKKVTGRHAIAITTTHRINAYALQMLDSTDEASSSENALALTGGGFNAGVPRLWHAIVTRSVALAGENFHEIQTSAFTMKPPPLCRRYFKGLSVAVGGKPSQVLIRKSVCLPFLGEWGRCAKVTTEIKTRGSTSARSHGFTDWIVWLFVCVSFRSDSDKEGLNEYF
jgi:hypothetical protein